jgi:putative spermidine/putrescine transport system ATP-binding protein
LATGNVEAGPASASGAESAATGRDGRPTGGVEVNLRNLHRSFGSLHALDGMSLDVAAGELVVLLGPSGCGKTTALRVLAGLEDMDSGAVIVAGRDISGTPTNKRQMGMVFQAYSLFPHLTALENVAFGLRLRGRNSVDRNRVSGEYLELVGLSDKAGTYPHELSGGQQQRVALARALAIAPQVLLLDEPLSALDAKVRLQLRDEIRRIQLELGTTTLFVTHDQEEALAVADRVGVMRAGRLEQIDAPEAIYSRPRTAFVAEFIGLTNRLPGLVSGDVATVLGSSIPLLPGSVTAGPATVLIRPESMHLTATNGAGSAVNGATVVATSFLGSHGRVQARLADGTVLLAQVPTSTAAQLSVDDQVLATISPAPALAIAAR